MPVQVLARHEIVPCFPDQPPAGLPGRQPRTSWTEPARQDKVYITGTIHPIEEPAVNEEFAVVVRPTRTATWNLLRNGAAVASAYAVCRPDRRWFVSVDGWHDTDHEPLVNAMIDDLAQDLYTRIDGSDPAALELWSRSGFEPHRRELEFVFSPAPDRTGLGDASLPDGLVLLSAEDVDEGALRELDDELRLDVPGSEGWVNDPAEFHDYTFAERAYDPATYLVAVDDRRQQFAGLVRIWANQERSRLGLIAVSRSYRRRGLARAMLAAALAPVHERHLAQVLAEADADNTASLALLRRIGAVETGSSLVLKRVKD
jgi:ribosomal protein S18 acetylase RimI-like enzyme